MAKAKKKYIKQNQLDPRKLEDVFAMKVCGDCMAPLLTHGQMVVVDKTAKMQPDDLVIFFLKPEYVAKGNFQCAIKRLILNARAGGDIKPVLIVADASGKTYAIPAEHLLGVYKAEPARPNDGFHESKVKKDAILGKSNISISKGGAWGGARPTS